MPDRADPGNNNQHILDRKIMTRDLSIEIASLGGPKVQVLATTGQQISGFTNKISRGLKAHPISLNP